jgi:hypothetical protein
MTRGWATDTHVARRLALSNADSVLDHAKQAIEIEDVEVRVAVLENSRSRATTTINLRRRLEALEKDLTSEPILLLMPGGRIETREPQTSYATAALEEGGLSDPGTFPVR